jgi:hypothetical protein
MSSIYVSVRHTTITHSQAKYWRLRMTAATAKQFREQKLAWKTLASHGIPMMMMKNNNTNKRGLNQQKS